MGWGQFFFKRHHPIIKYIIPRIGRKVKEKTWFFRVFLVKFCEEKRSAIAHGEEKVFQGRINALSLPLRTKNFCHKMLHLRGLFWKEKSGRIRIIEKYLFDNGGGKILANVSIQLYSI